MAWHETIQRAPNDRDGTRQDKQQPSRVKQEVLDSLRETDGSVVGTIDFPEHAIHEVLHALGALLETSKVVPIHEVEHLRGKYVEKTHTTLFQVFLPSMLPTATVFLM